MTKTPSDALSAIETGRRYACAIRERDGAVVCWGDCASSTRCSAPAPSARFVGLALDDDDGGCAWDASGRAQCWGGFTTRSPLPADFAGISIAHLVFGSNWAVALKRDGTLAAWGSSEVVRDPAIDNAVRTKKTFSAIGGRGALICLIDTSGTPSCVVYYSNQTPPVAPGRAVQIAASNPRGAIPACVLAETAPAERQAICTESNKSLTLPRLSGDILSMAVGDDHLCVLRRDATVECVGDDLYGTVTGKSKLRSPAWP